MNTLKKYVVVEDWIESYENPIVLKRRDKVTLDLSEKEPDPEWTDWVWCIADNGMNGWVPIQILEIQKNISEDKQTAIVSEDYSAYELSVDKGDVVIGSRILNGWLWCRKENSDLDGWIPLRNVKEVNELL